MNDETASVCAVVCVFGARCNLTAIYVLISGRLAYCLHSTVLGSRALCIIEAPEKKSVN